VEAENKLEDYFLFAWIGLHLPMDPQKPFGRDLIVVWNPTFRDAVLPGRYCTERASGNSIGFLRDFGYDHAAPKDVQVDENATRDRSSGLLYEL